ncbi:L30e-like protein [Ramicandelaber brevisporus]|nr:L30e-like protein [Ramicandelaber brevisporus]
MAPKKVAPAPAIANKGKAAAAVASKNAANPLFERKPRNFGIGQEIQPKKDLRRYVKWPEYVRHQRQRKILNMRLKVPPAINQFTKVADRNTATKLFSLADKYRPETNAEKKARLLEAAAKKANKEEVKTPKPVVVKYGLNHVTALVENKKAQLVVIANDVNPIELVLWLPALCRKMGIPYVIVKGKARLGTVVHKKTSAVLAFTEVKPEDQAELAALVTAAKGIYEKDDKHRKHWGGGIMGAKSQAVMRKRAAAAAKELTIN